MAASVRILGRTVLGRGHSLLERITFGRHRFDGRSQEMTRDVYQRGDAAAILLYDTTRSTVVLVRQFRPGAYLNGGKPDLIEVPAGKLEGDDPVTCIIRETAEETGFAISNPRRVFEAYMSPAYVTEKMTFFIAPYTAANRAGDGGGLVDEGEDIEILEPTFAEALAMIERGEIADVKTIALLNYAALNNLIPGTPPPHSASST